MSDLSKVAIIKDLLDSANRDIAQAQKLISEITGDVASVPSDVYTKQAEKVGGAQVADEGERIIEGIFDGQAMTDATGTTYPVPVNYASKSKLVPGDQLKLTIQQDGRFLYKQIGPAERKYLVGPLSYEEGQYTVLSEGKAYKVLLASVTYYKAEIGDEVTIIVPALQESEWAAIDAVLPKYENVMTDEEI